MEVVMKELDEVVMYLELGNSIFINLIGEDIYLQRHIGKYETENVLITRSKLNMPISEHIRRPKSHTIKDGIDIKTRIVNEYLTNYCSKTEAMYLISELITKAVELQKTTEKTVYIIAPVYIAKIIGKLVYPYPNVFVVYPEIVKFFNSNNIKALIKWSRDEKRWAKNCLRR